MADESYVQVAPDSTGKQIRNLKASQRVVETGGQNSDQPVENFYVRYMQALVVADPVTGRLQDLAAAPEDMALVLRDIRTELRITNFLLAQGLFGNKEAVDPVALRGEPAFNSD